MQRSSNEPNPTNLSGNTALPNNYGNIRTLKDDLANLKSGKKELPEEPLLQSLPPQSPLPPPPPPQPPVPQAPEAHYPSPPKIAASPPVPEKKISFSNIAPPQKEKVAKPGKEIRGSDLPDPFGSETFFQTQSPFDEKTRAPKNEPEKVSKKSSRKLPVVLFFLFILALLGGGAYYWWFFLKPSKTETAPTASETVSQDTKAAVAENESAESSSLKQWTLDPKADKIANKLTIERYVKGLAGSAPQGKAVEIKLSSSGNQLITPQIFSNIFDFSFPASVSQKLTDDYSLFVSYENSEPRLGAAFKLAQSGNLAESLRSEEKDLFPNLKSFYLDKLPANSKVIFSSSKYKNADIRYFNFLSPANISLDYTVLSSGESSYFIFSTSKNSIRAILDYMSEK